MTCFRAQACSLMFEPGNSAPLSFAVCGGINVTPGKVPSVLARIRA